MNHAEKPRETNLGLQDANLLRHEAKSDGVEKLAPDMSTLMFNMGLIARYFQNEVQKLHFF